MFSLRKERIMLFFKMMCISCLSLICLAACQAASSTLRANAGQDFSVIVGTSPTFDGCASRGDIVNYRWTIVDAPDSNPGDVGKVIRELSVDCLFSLESLMEIEEVGDWGVELEVRDTGGSTDTDTVVVSVVR
jgi:hypothetical protein